MILYGYVVAALAVPALARSAAGTIGGSMATSSASFSPAGMLDGSGNPTVPPSHDVGRTPALGWNSGVTPNCANIDENTILAAANDLVSLGLAKAGYQYVNLDACWASTSRDTASGQMVPDKTRFPNGLKGVADTIHSLGLKFGLLSSAGTTCDSSLGSGGNEYLDASTFVGWGVDDLKYRNCDVPSDPVHADPPNGDWYNSSTAIRNRIMTAALNATNHPVQFNLCLWGGAHVYDWGARVGHTWRIGDDSKPTWDSITSIIALNVQHLAAIDLFSHNDMDWVQIGNGKLTIQEQRTNFAAWCFLKSPILLQTNLTQLSTKQIDIITNAELLAFHQDPVVGKSAMPFAPTSSSTIPSLPEFYTGKSSNGVHVFIINTGSSTANMTFDFAQIPALGDLPLKMHDMWTGKGLGTYTTSYTATVESHDTAAFLLIPDVASG